MAWRSWLAKVKQTARKDERAPRRCISNSRGARGASRQQLRGVRGIDGLGISIKRQRRGSEQSTCLLLFE